MARRTSTRLRIQARGGRISLASVDSPRARPPRKIVENTAQPVATGRDDGLPHPQAFSLTTIQLYPQRTAICRQCEHLDTDRCSARGCCRKMRRSHDALVQAIGLGECPEGKFTPGTTPGTPGE